LISKSKTMTFIVLDEEPSRVKKWQLLRTFMISLTPDSLHLGKNIHPWQWNSILSKLTTTSFGSAIYWNTNLLPLVPVGVSQ
jgi:hypothetical protein